MECKKATYFNYAVTPNIGYFLYDRFVGGLKIGVSHNKENYGDLINERIPVASGGYSNMTWFDVGPFLRYYFLKTENQVNLFTEGNYIFGAASTKPGKGQRTSYSFFAGPVVYFNSSVGLEFKIGYIKYKSTLFGLNSSDDDFSSKNGQFQIGLGLQAHLEN